MTTSREEVNGFVDKEELASLHERNSGSGGKLNDADANNSSAERKKRTVRRREIQLVVRPFWPMLLFITCPLIFGVSILTLWSGIPGKSVYVQISWALMTMQLIQLLFNMRFRDPGMLSCCMEPPSADIANKNGGDCAPRRRLGGP